MNFVNSCTHNTSVCRSLAVLTSSLNKCTFISGWFCIIRVSKLTLNFHLFNTKCCSSSPQCLIHASATSVTKINELLPSMVSTAGDWCRTINAVIPLYSAHKASRCTWICKHIRTYVYKKLLWSCLPWTSHTNNPYWLQQKNWLVCLSTKQTCIVLMKSVNDCKCLLISCCAQSKNVASA